MKDVFKGFILGLHNIEPRSYKNECSVLYDNLTVTPEILEDFIVSCRNKGFDFVTMKRFLLDKQDDKMHKNIVITIDDGWKGIYTHGFPLFKRNNVPFVFYIASDLINNGFKNCKLPEMDGMDILLDYVEKNEKDPNKKEKTFKKIWKKFKYRKRLFFWQDGHKIMQSLFKEKIDFDYYKNKNCCAPAELKEMAECDLCEIGGHTHNHVHMDRISKKNVIKQLDENIRNIELYTGKRCESFSYPYGHYNRTAYDEVKKRYASAVIVQRKDNKYYYPIMASDDIYAMPRKFIDNDFNFDNLLKTASL